MSDLSFCLPVEPPAQGGGGFRFLHNFESYLTEQGIPWTRSVTEGARVLFLNSWQTQPRTIRRALLHRPDMTVVHRIDGAAQDYGREPSADRVLAAVNRFADVTIFQSRYCRTATRDKWKVVSHDGLVIHNAVDTSVFRPDGPLDVMKEHSQRGICCAVVSWSTNPMKGREAVLDTARRNPNVMFILAGRFETPTLPNVVSLGVLDHPSLARVLRGCDLLLTYSRNEACPNHVIEAMACGLPVLYAYSGATPELVQSAGYTVTPETFAAKLMTVTVERERLRENALRIVRERFSPGVVFPRYLDAITSRLRPVASWSLPAAIRRMRTT